MPTQRDRTRAPSHHSHRTGAAVAETSVPRRERSDSGHAAGDSFTNRGPADTRAPETVITVEQFLRLECERQVALIRTKSVELQQRLRNEVGAACKTSLRALADP
eukprot:ctg_940.g402